MFSQQQRKLFLIFLNGFYAPLHGSNWMRLREVLSTEMHTFYMIEDRYLSHHLDVNLCIVGQGDMFPQGVLMTHEIWIKVHLFRGCVRSRSTEVIFFLS